MIFDIFLITVVFLVVLFIVLRAMRKRTDNHHNASLHSTMTHYNNIPQPTRVRYSSTGMEDEELDALSAAAAYDPILPVFMTTSSVVVDLEPEQPQFTDFQGGDSGGAGASDRWDDDERRRSEVVSEAVVYEAPADVPDNDSSYESCESTSCEVSSTDE